MAESDFNPQHSERCHIPGGSELMGSGLGQRLLGHHVVHPEGPPQCELSISVFKNETKKSLCVPACQLFPPPLPPLKNESHRVVWGFFQQCFCSRNAFLTTSTDTALPQTPSMAADRSLLPQLSLDLGGIGNWQQFARSLPGGSGKEEGD